VEPSVYHYPRCSLRDATRAVAGAVPPLRAVVALAWPAARRADRIEIDASGIRAWCLAGEESIAWDEVGAIRRARTTWGRMTMHIVSRDGSRQIEIAETLPGFTQLHRLLVSARPRPVAAA
jgi:hypothetical protein